MIVMLEKLEIVNFCDAASNRWIKADYWLKVIIAT